MGSKTPVSILQEMMVRKGFSPVYDLIHDATGTHQAVFKYQVHAGVITATGSGQSKKEAKHDAAKKALEKIRGEEATNTPEPSVPEEAIDVESPYHNKLQQNAVGQLQELCLMNSVVSAGYKLIGDEGPPHAKQFTILCQINNLQEIAVARTKKQAKQLAAFKMLNSLKPLLGDLPDSIKNPNSPTLSDKNLKTVVNKFKETSVSSSCQKSRLGMKIIDYPNELKGLIGVELCELKKIDPNDVEDAKELLNKILEEIGAKAEYTSIEDVNLAKEMHPEEEALQWKPSPAKRMKTGYFKFMTLLNVLTIPDFVTWGKDNTSQESSDKMAAKMALNYLKIMT